jgi:hypothetical protein
MKSIYPNCVAHLLICYFSIILLFVLIIVYFNCYNFLLFLEVICIHLETVQ